jgi:hypothetical protein
VNPIFFKPKLGKAGSFSRGAEVEWHHIAWTEKFLTVVILMRQVKNGSWKNYWITVPYVETPFLVN